MKRFLFMDPPLSQHIYQVKPNQKIKDELKLELKSKKSEKLGIP